MHLTHKYWYTAQWLHVLLLPTQAKLQGSAGSDWEQGIDEILSVFVSCSSRHLQYREYLMLPCGRQRCAAYRYPAQLEIFAFGPWPVSVALIAQNPSPSPQKRRHRPSSGQGLGENPAMAASIRGIPAVQPISTQRGNPSGLQRAPALKSQSRRRCRSTQCWQLRNRSHEHRPG